MEQFEKKIQYTPEDLQLAYATHLKKMYPIRSRMLLVIAAVSFIIGCILLFYERKNGSVDYTNWAAWFLIAYGVAIAGLYFYNQHNLGKRMFSKMPDFINPFSYIFSSEQIQVSSDNINNTNKWEFYESALITPEIIILYPNKFRFNLFPRKYFTDEEFDMLKQWIRAKIKTKEVK
ncbi:MAG TPA: YcxB family protein [Bacteroidales bacterium]|nr:YcxB family protein [Bacteroidales bacterium]HOV10318.1 YcxB family protein [Bacteroidales bacterium]HQI69708.1 YcxB family protein [Bacteroidales bacterium]